MLTLTLTRAPAIFFIRPVSYSTTRWLKRFFACFFSSR
jgi:hypothetical protein